MTAAADQGKQGGRGTVPASFSQHSDCGRTHLARATNRWPQEALKPMLKKLVFAGAVLALSAPAGAAFADEWGHMDRHEQDHHEHGRFHDQVDEGHARAHAEGFSSRREHRGYHRALRDTHREFHYEHPSTRHDGYRLPSRRGYGYYGYPSYGYGGYYGYGRGGRRW